MEYEAPEDGFLAFYIYVSTCSVPPALHFLYASSIDVSFVCFSQMEFPASNDEKYIFTTEVNVVPNYFPFEDCEGEECQGILK